MITNRQMREYLEMTDRGKTKREAALRAGMDRKTARRYEALGQLPMEAKKPHVWRTRPDPFGKVIGEVRGQWSAEPKLQAKTLMGWLCDRYPGRFKDGQLRTLQRRLAEWRVVSGEEKEIFFEQTHQPGELSASDFTCMNELGITIAQQAFKHLLFGMVLTCSNRRWATIAMSESFEELANGMGKCTRKLGGVTRRHRTDNLSAAVVSPKDKKYTARYLDLMAHYGMTPEAINPGRSHENGDIEKTHDVVKTAIDQALMLRGSRDFDSEAAYEAWLEKILERLNRDKKVEPLFSLPSQELKVYSEIQTKVRQGSTIRLSNNHYSVPSSLIGKWVDVRLWARTIEVYWRGRRMLEAPRQRGEGKTWINYRHFVFWLLRKPGAFRNYRWREELFPTPVFRKAYDRMEQNDKEYLHILHEAAVGVESDVEAALLLLIEGEEKPTLAKIRDLIGKQVSTDLDRWQPLEADMRPYDALIGAEV
jgi:transposase InsO family protein